MGYHFDPKTYLQHTTQMHTLIWHWMKLKKLAGWICYQKCCHYLSKLWGWAISLQISPKDHLFRFYIKEVSALVCLWWETSQCDDMLRKTHGKTISNIKMFKVSRSLLYAADRNVNFKLLLEKQLTVWVRSLLKMLIPFNPIMPLLRK